MNLRAFGIPADFASKLANMPGFALQQSCGEGHPVDILKPGQQGECVKCNATTLVKTLVHCIMCRNIMCTDCVTAAINDPTPFLRCPRKHRLVVTKKAGFRCDNCGTSGDGARWRCDRCDYDVCFTCRAFVPEAPKSTLTVSPIRSVGPIVEAVCKQDHIMLWSNGQVKFSQIRGYNFDCEYCNRKIQCNEGYWACRTCKYAYCRGCCSIPRPPKSKEVGCNYYHELQWTRSKDPAGGLFCSKCTRSTDSSMGHWICLDCSDLYEICMDCYATSPAGGVNEKAKNFDEPVVQLLDPYLCWAAHSEYWDITVGQSPQVNCIRCKKGMACSSGRWRCGVCDYNFCDQCKGFHLSKSLIANQS